MKTLTLVVLVVFTTISTVNMSSVKHDDQQIDFSNIKSCFQDLKVSQGRICQNHQNTEKWYYDAVDRTCYINRADFFFPGGKCIDLRHANSFRTKRDCKQECNDPIKKYRKACSLEKKPGPCKGSFPKYYYDTHSGQCLHFIYGGCQGNLNRFDTLEDCEQLCVRDPIKNVCTLEKEPGMCKAYMPSYYYDTHSGQCQLFIYGGCGGNANRFQTIDDCEQKCVQDPIKNVCKLEKETGPCKAAFKKFYYDTHSGQCQTFIYGGCQGNANRFDSLADCEKKCMD